MHTRMQKSVKLIYFICNNILHILHMHIRTVQKSFKLIYCIYKISQIKYNNNTDGVS